MIVDKVRFLTTEKCEYGNFTLFFGLLGDSVVPKWHYVNKEEEVFLMVKSLRQKTAALRIVGLPEHRTKLFYIPKIEKLRVEHRASMKVNKLRKIETN